LKEKKRWINFEWVGSVLKLSFYYIFPTFLIVIAYKVDRWCCSDCWLRELLFPQRTNKLGLPWSPGRAHDSLTAQRKLIITNKGVIPPSVVNTMECKHQTRLCKLFDWTTYLEQFLDFFLVLFEHIYSSLLEMNFLHQSINRFFHKTFRREPKLIHLTSVITIEFQIECVNIVQSWLSGI
jgi:hypothetical protein